jgi:2-oxoglutarate/2-oxoacid ferredoxin oxidoreductase subunit beta
MKQQDQPRLHSFAESEGGGATATENRPPLKAADYKSGRKPIWCPGCGDYGVLNSIFGSLAGLNLDPDRLVVVSGIGCSSRMPGFIRAYGFHGAHGRAVPVAVGVKVANPSLDVLVVGGDGDGFSIGGGHLSHAARRNINLTYVVMDNEIYGLTKGQVSPTSPTRSKAKSAPYGTVEGPINPLLLMLAYGATYVARGYASQAKQLSELIEGGMRHNGFAFIQVLSPCVTFNKVAGYDFFKEHVAPLPAEHKSDDYVDAMRLAAETDLYHLGLFYQTQRPEYTDSLREHGGRATGAPRIDVDNLIKKYS